MAGHSHWARIKRAKAVTDARRGKVWSKLSRAIIVAARAGGGDPSANLALRYAIDAARDVNMPKDTIERAIKKGSGEGGTEDYAEIIYEGYGPGGVAILCAALTDNRTRTVGEVRNIFERRGGNLGASGCVAWMFNKRGVLIIPASQADEERVTQVAIEAGADDVSTTSDAFEVACAPDLLSDVRAAFVAAGVAPESAEITMVAENTLELSGDLAQRCLALIETLEDHDDLQKVYTNLALSEEDAAKLAE